jgi:D-lyxose ketol-isomerase
MLTRKQHTQARDRAAAMMRGAGIRLTEKEVGEMDVADFGLNHLAVEGAQIVSFFNTDRVSAKIIALLPNQALPEHWHTAVGEDPGKEETIRVIDGTVYVFLPGEESITHGHIPAAKGDCYTARHEVVMQPGDQMTLQPGVKHWFQGSREGAVMYSFSSAARCALDPFTDPDIVRVTKIVEADPDD